jgi:hypothetical protein
MIERYTIKAAPAVPHSEVLKKLDEMKDFDPDEMRKLQHLKVKVEVICEAADLKRITDLLKELSKK